MATASTDTIVELTKGPSERLISPASEGSRTESVLYRVRSFELPSCTFQTEEDARAARRLTGDDSWCRLRARYPGGETRQKLYATPTQGSDFASSLAETVTSEQDQEQRVKLSEWTDGETETTHAGDTGTSKEESVMGGQVSVATEKESVTSLPDKTADERSSVATKHRQGSARVTKRRGTGTKARRNRVPRDTNYSCGVSKRSNPREGLRRSLRLSEQK